MGRPARVRDLYETLKLEREANLKGRKRELPESMGPLGAKIRGALMAAEVSTDDVRRYIRARQEKGAAPATINRELATLKRMFRLATQSTPPEGYARPLHPHAERGQRAHGLCGGPRIRAAHGERNGALASHVSRLADSYGWRRAELLGLRVRQVNLVARTVRLDPGTTKNREGRQVEMTGKVADLLREALRVAKKPDDFVLTRTGGARVRDFRNAWQELCVRAGLGQYVCKKCARKTQSLFPPRQNWLRGQHGAAYRCPQCLASKHRAFRYSGLILRMRRSAAKALRAAGVPEQRGDWRMGGWKTAAMFRRYAIVSGADGRAAVEMLERSRAQRAAAVAETAPETAPFGVGASAVAPGAKLN